MYLDKVITTACPFNIGDIIFPKDNRDGLHAGIVIDVFEEECNVLIIFSDPEIKPEITTIKNKFYYRATSGTEITFIQE